MAFVNDIRTGAFKSEGHGFFRAAAERFVRYNVYRRTVDELSVMSNHELADLGLSRATIRATAYEAAYA